MKPKTLLTSMLLLLCNVLTAQSGFSAGVVLEPLRSAMTISDSGIPMNLTEEGLGDFGYAFGAQVQYDMRKNIFVRSGIRYQRLGTCHRITGFIIPSPAYGVYQAYIQNEITIRSFAVPLDIGFKFPSKNGTNGFLLGLSASLNIDAHTKSETTFVHSYGQGVEQLEASGQVSESAFSIGVFGGFELGLFDKFVFAIEPNVKLSPHDFDLYLSHAKARVYEAGITLRIRTSM